MYKYYSYEIISPQSRNISLIWSWSGYVEDGEIVLR